MLLFLYTKKMPFVSPIKSNPHKKADALFWIYAGVMLALENDQLLARRRRRVGRKRRPRGGQQRPRHGPAEFAARWVGKVDRGGTLEAQLGHEVLAILQHFGVQMLQRLEHRLVAAVGLLQVDVVAVRPRRFHHDATVQVLML